jgi:hypothetical protein
LKTLDPDIPCALLLDAKAPLDRESTQLSRAELLGNLPLAEDELAVLALSLIRGERRRG